MNQFKPLLNVLRKAFYLSRPYGTRKLAIVFLWVLAQGTMQVIGVTSIFPFLAVAADPERIRQSAFGKWALPLLPTMDNYRLLILSGILAIMLLFISNAVNLASEVTRVRYGHQFGHWLRMRLLGQITAQQYGFFLQNNSSSLFKKVVSDVSQYVQGVLLPLLDSIARLLTVGLLLLLIFLVDPMIAVFSGIGLGGFYALVLVYLNKRLHATSDGLKEASRGLAREASQILSGIKPVKVHRVEEFFIDRFALHSATQSRLLSRIPIYANGPRYLVEPLAFGGLVGLVLLFAVQGRSLAEVLPVLGVMALAGYRLIPTLQLLYGQVAQLTTMIHHLDEIYDEFRGMESMTVLENEGCGGPEPLRWKKDIVLDHVTFSYPGSAKPVLDDISLTIPKNSSVAFVGRTGCGKSTLLDLLLRLHRPGAGRILVDGHELTSQQTPSWLVGIGYVPQDIFLIDDTIAANIALGIPESQIDPIRLREVCTIAQILDLIDQDLPEGMRTMVGERGVRLSGGQRQRIGLARALYHRPHILVLDEATSALDQATEADLNEALDPLRGSLTMIIVAHRLSTIQRSDVIYTLEAGRIRCEIDPFAMVPFSDPL